MSNLNREIYNRNYTEKNLSLNTRTAYDREMTNHRFSLIEKYGSGKDVIDLCCGTGTYLLPVLSKVKSAVGIDFSSSLLEALRKKSVGAKNLTIIEADARNIPLPDGSADFIFSYTSLYHVPQVHKVLKEIARLLRPKGIASIELGNLYSINTINSFLWHRYEGFGRPYHVSLPEMKRMIQKAGLTIEKWDSYQLLPMYAPPKKFAVLYPLVGAHWKRLLSPKVGGKMLDNWISSAGPLKYFSFRQQLLLRK